MYGLAGVTRHEFEAIRDLPGKVILRPVILAAKNSGSAVLEARDIVIQNSAGIDLRMVVRFNINTTAKNINVSVPQLGPICRLDVDSTVHGDAGRHHKHDLWTPECPAKNLPHNVKARSELAGKGIAEVFSIFCDNANIFERGIKIAYSVYSA